MINLQPHRVALAAVVQLVLDRLEQVRRLLLVNVELAVARHPERPVTQQPGAREQIRQVMPDQPVQMDVILAPIRARQLHDAWQVARYLHHRHLLEHLLVARHLQPHHQVQRLVQQLRERMRRVNRQRRQHRADLRVVVILHPGQIRRLQLRHLQQPDAVRRQGRQQLAAPAAVLLLDHAPHPLDDGAERLGRGQPVHRALHYLAFDLLLDPGHAHLEELIQVRADDAEELHPLQQRVFRVQRLLQHAMIKLQPAQFPIDEMSRPDRLRFCFGCHNRLQGTCRAGVWKVTKRRGQVSRQGG